MGDPAWPVVCSSTPSVSVIIVNYNAGTLLLDCVDSCSDEDTEVIVVDNQSSDNSIDLLRTKVAKATKSVTIIVNESNLGFAAACNIGASAAQAASLLFLNPDCRMDPGALKVLTSTLANNPQSGMVGGLLVDPDGTEQGGGRRAVPTPWRSFVRTFGLARFAHRWPKLFYDFYLHKQPLPEHPVEVEAISGACMLVRREAIEQVGPWDEGYFLHCEDLDWCMRFRMAGWQILFVPEARVVHHQGGCSQSRIYFVEWHKHKGMVRFYQKFFRNQYPGALMVIVSIGVWLRFAAVLAMHLSTKTINNFKAHPWRAKQDHQ